MLELIILGDDYFDEVNNTFITRGDVTLQLEHSLVSLSKWESIFEKPFLSKEVKTTEEIIAYIECMNLTPKIAPEVFSRLSSDNYDKINAYIDRKMTATWFSEVSGTPRTSEIITSELIYFWLVTFNIPWEAQYWHINRLFTLIKIANLKNAKPKQMSRSEIAARNRELNARRKKEYGTSG